MHRILVLFLIAVTASVSAATPTDSPIYIDILTAGARVDYVVNNQPMTTEQMTKWMALQVSAGDPVLIRPSEDTTFKTVFSLLTLLKDVGMKRIEVLDYEEVKGNFEQFRGLRLAPENIASWKRRLQQPSVVVPTR